MYVQMRPPVPPSVRPMAEDLHGGGQHEQMKEEGRGVRKYRFPCCHQCAGEAQDGIESEVPHELLLLVEAIHVLDIVVGAIMTV